MPPLERMIDKILYILRPPPPPLERMPPPPPPLERMIDKILYILRPLNSAVHLRWARQCARRLRRLTLKKTPRT